MVTKSRRLRLVGYLANMEEYRNAFKILPVGMPGGRWEYNSRIKLNEIGINTRNWIDSTKYRNY